MSVIIAHRGASGEAPENTMAAFRRALEMEVDFLELDVQFSLDGQMVVIHDATLGRTTSGQGQVADATFEQIQDLDAGSWFSRRFKGEKVPTLTEVICLVKPTSCNLLVEFKADRKLPTDFEKTVARVIREYGMHSRVILQSLDHQAVQKIKREDPSIEVGALIDSRSPQPVVEAKALGASKLVLKSRFVGPELLSEAHQNDIGMFVWTVNSRGRIRRMLRLGVDGIISDYPDRVLLHRSKLGLGH